MYRTCSLTLAAALTTAGATLTAQRPDTARIAPVVVTATRTPLDAAASPATVSVISGDDLRRRGVTSLASALQIVPGLVFAQNGSPGAATSLFLRGGESKYVKVLVDGVPMNDPGGAMDFSAVTVDNVDRIEIVRGPASVLYGADAVTGVIQIFTRRGRGAPRTIVSARAGKYHAADADASVLGAFTGGDYSLAIARHDTRGLYAFNNGFHNSVASGAVHVAVDPRTDLRLSLRYNDAQFHYPTNSAGEPVDSNAGQTAERTTLAAELGHVFATRLDARLTLTSETSAGGTDDPKDDPAGAGYQSVDRTRRRGADLRANFVPADGTTLTAGVALEQQDQRNEGYTVFGASYQSTDVFSVARRNTGYYLQALSTFADSATLTAGLRRDDNEAFGAFDTYRLGASWRLPTATRLRASIGSAFREPSFYENYATGYVTGNKELTPERSAMWEIGIRQPLLADRLVLGLTHFDQRFTNMIDYTGSTKACGASYCNVARARAKGREIEAQFAATSYLSFDANLTHLETRVLDAGFDTSAAGLYRAGQALIRRPTTTWNLGAALAGALGSADVRITHVGERGDRNFGVYPAQPVVDPAYTRVDLGAVLPLARFAPGLRGAELTLHVENLLDAKYVSVYRFLSPRTAALVGARLTF